MATIRIRLVRNRGLSSWGIGYFGAGRYSHGDIVLPDGRLLGARADWVGGRPPGVQIRPADYDAKTRRFWCVMSLEVSPEEERRFLDFAFLQVFHGYDHSAIWGFAMDRDWRDPDRWFCTELVAACLEYAHILKVHALNKVFPGALFTICDQRGFQHEFSG